ncbi:hypothetical protein NFHSH190041_30280 [Shewanella sp. NFH-SH190041]|uniref:hypothetical protein n=1 Tax=Shewanella sp. NFH-SH190041 TaxID=2950245 RepID=UPI0021C3E8AC|nr:hypothetical protein [Shewanella sp. NFH-SH190041]BDM65576.1 hypothetical protein NFHSH190041_30280 [Shewanella sp. NFH-SH190041]
MLQLTKFFRTLPMTLWLMLSLTLTVLGVVVSLPATLSRGITWLNFKMAMTGLYLQYLDANDYVSTGKYGNRLLTAFKRNRK